MSMPETSVIIRTFNEQKRLPALFDRLARQTYKPFETIVVDSGSFDRTREIASQRADRLVRISSHDFTFGYSLNRGIREARGRFCAIVSAHTVPADDWLERLIASLRTEGVAMTYGRQIGVACSKFSEAEDFERLFGMEPLIERSDRFAVNNANSAIRRDLWSQHPFDEQLTGLEDIAWARHWMAQGFIVRYEPSAVLEHIHEETWSQIRRRYFREAVAWRHMGLKRRRDIPRILRQGVSAAVKDAVSALTSTRNPVCERLAAGQRLREIAYYRLHQTVGTLRGLLEAHPLETRKQQEEVLFDRSTDAVVIGGPGRAALQAIDLPELKPGDVLVRVANVGVCATDIEMFEGRLGYYKNGVASYPIVPGHEFSGTIAATGPNVTAFTEGDPVVVECIQSCGACKECRAGNFIGCADRTEFGVFRRNGAYARYTVAPAQFVHKLPPGLDLRRAALCEPLAVILKGLRRLAGALPTGAQASRRCLVLGAGPLGHLCALVLARRGHVVWGYDRNPTRLGLLHSTGIRPLETLEDLSEFNLIVEVTGDPGVLNEALHKSPANACLLLLGLPYGQREFSFEAIAAYDKTVIGSVGSTAEDFRAALDLLQALPLDRYLDCNLPLSDFARAWEVSRRGEVLKVILEVN